MMCGGSTTLALAEEVQLIQLNTIKRNGCMLTPYDGREMWAAPRCANHLSRGAEELSSSASNYLSVVEPLDGNGSRQ